MATTRVRRRPDLPPPPSFGPGAVLLYDRRLGRHRPFRAWIGGFPRRLPLPAGEAAKAVEAFPPLATRLVRLVRDLGRREIRLVALGGGAATDVVGFLASLLRRGVAWESVPTTWLAAVDSAHGGKTALNAGAKNAFGTFHPAARVHLVGAVLRQEPAARAREAAAELLKMAFLDGGPWARRLLRSRGAAGEVLWRYLLPAVRAKMRLVAADPEETRGERRILNLGHTLGHVLEAAHGLPHGAAVAQGLHFALRWSVARAGLPAARAEGLRAVLTRLAAPYRPHAFPPLPPGRFRALLGQDKKLLPGGRLDFVFLRDLGVPVRRPVSLAAVERAARGEGWAR